MKFSNFGYLMFATLIFQIINLSISPILAIYYSASQLGEYKYYFSILTIGSVFCGLALDKAIYTSEDVTDDVAIIKLVLMLSLLVTSILIISVLLLDLNIYIYVMAFLIPFFSIFPHCCALLAKHNLFKQLSIYRLVGLSLSPVIKLLTCFTLNPIVFLLFFTDFISRLAGYIYILTRNIQFVKVSFLKSKFIYILNDKKSYITKVFPGVLINNLSLILPVLYINYFYNLTNVGVYTLAIALTQTPLTIFGSNISTVLQSSYKNGRVRAVFHTYFVNLFKILVPIPVIVLIYSNDLIDLLYENEWEMVNDIIFVISFSAIIWALTSPFSVIFHLHNKEKLLLRVQVLKFVIKLISYFLAALYLNFNQFVILICIVNSILQVAHFVVTLRVIDLSFEYVELVKPFLLIVLLFGIQLININFIYLLILSVFILAVLNLKEVKKIVFS